MSLSVADALREGLGRTFQRSGLQLVGVFVVVQLASLVATNTLNRANLAYAAEAGALPSEFASGPFAGLADAPTPFALEVGLAGAAVLFLVVALVAEAARLVAVRTLAAAMEDGVDAAAVRRNLGVATVNGFVGGLVVYTLSALGLVLLVLPGLYLAVSFYFVRQEIALRDANFVEAMSNSWSLAAGNRFGVLGLAVALLLASLLTFVPGLVLGGLSPAVASVLGALVQAVFVVFAVASVTRAYVQLREGGEPPEDEADPYAGALSADDLPEPERGHGP